MAGGTSALNMQDRCSISLLVVGYKRNVTLDNSTAGRVHILGMLLEGSSPVGEDEVPCSKASRVCEAQFNQFSLGGELQTGRRVIAVTIVGP